MAKKAKTTKTEIINKVIETCDYLILPVCGVASIWGYDISVYVAAAGGMLVSILTFVKLFVKD